MCKILKVKINLFFFSISVSGCLCTTGRGEGGGGSGERKREAEWVEEWKKRRIEAVRGGGIEAGEPRAGEHSCGSPWALWLPSSCGPGAAYRGPGEPAGASQSCGRVGRLGQPSQERGR